jgi:hypothetical protein
VPNVVCDRSIGPLKATVGHTVVSVFVGPDHLSVALDHVQVQTSRGVIEEVDRPVGESFGAVLAVVVADPGIAPQIVLTA